MQTALGQRPKKRREMNSGRPMTTKAGGDELSADARKEQNHVHPDIQPGALGSGVRHSRIFSRKELRWWHKAQHRKAEENASGLPGGEE